MLVGGIRGGVRFCVGVEFFDIPDLTAFQLLL